MSLIPLAMRTVIDELVNGAVTRTCAYGLRRISENQLISGTLAPSFYGYDGPWERLVLAHLQIIFKSDCRVFMDFRIPILLSVRG